MKRHVQEPGIRKWSGDDLLDLQHEPLKAIEGFITNYAPCILSGCQITPAAEEGQYDVSPGLLSLRGNDVEGQPTQKIVPFAGATAVALPLYLTLAVEVEQRPYVTNGVQPVACDYKATAVALPPSEGEYFTLDAESPTFADVIQDAGHRFVSDSEKTVWDAKSTPDSVAVAIDEAIRNLSANKLVDISGWTGVFPSANANVGECFGQITEEWQCGVTYLIYYGSNRYPSTGIGAANRADMAHAFVYPKDTVSVGAYAGVVMPAGLHFGSNPSTYVLDRLAGNEFRYLGNVIYKIYRVK